MSGYLALVFSQTESEGEEGRCTPAGIGDEGIKSCFRSDLSHDCREACSLKDVCRPVSEWLPKS